MTAEQRSRRKAWVILIAFLLAVPILIVGTVAVMTWAPLQRAGGSLAELERNLGAAAVYIPAPSGRIPAERMELFLDLREIMVAACDDYGTVQKGFESVDALDQKDAADPGEVVDVARSLGGASLAITPFLARYFELRNDALLSAGMGLQEYVYIYAVAYHDQLLAERTQAQIFSDDVALSPEASALLAACLERQREAMGVAGGRDTDNELARMKSDPARLVWQDGLPTAIDESVAPYRDRLDSLFCAATAGLEMETGAARALRIALE